jgi:leader peptidase (prepilin peptidase) / N-methyltransferase
LSSLTRPVLWSGALGFTLVFGYLAFARLGWSPRVWGLIPLLFALGLVFMLDLRARIIPDVVTIPGIIYALGLSALQGQLPLGQAAFGALVGGSALLGVAVVSRGGVGGGDIKLMTMLGASIGWRAALVVLGLSQLAALVLVAALLVAHRAPSPFPIGALVAFLGAAALVAG